VGEIRAIAGTGLGALHGVTERARAGEEDLLPSPEAGPEASYARGILIEELADSIEALPAEQREVFLAHEIEGLSFREISALTGTSVNTLLARKRYAVLQLRRRLQVIYEEFAEE